MGGTVFKKGWSGGPGRPKGSKNKVSTFMKDLILDAVDNMEYEDKVSEETFYGEDAFIAWARRNPETFYTKFLTKLLPKPVEVSGIDGEDIKTSMVVLLPQKETVAALEGRREKLVKEAAKRRSEILIEAVEEPEEGGEVFGD